MIFSLARMEKYESESGPYQTNFVSWTREIKFGREGGGKHC